MDFTSYSGKQRTFFTHCSVALCVHTLQERDQDQRRGATRSTTTWAPLVRDAQVESKVHEQRFSLRVRQLRLPKRMYWTLNGTLEERDAGTLLTARYQPEVANNLIIWGSYGLSLLGIVRVVQNGMTTGWSQEYWWLAVFVGLGVVAMSGVARHNKQARVDEMKLVGTLQQVFGAHELL